MFEHKPFDPRAVMGFGILNGISIGLLNLSLGFNSVGFYQVHSVLLAKLSGLNMSLQIIFPLWVPETILGLLIFLVMDARALSLEAYN